MSNIKQVEIYGKLYPITITKLDLSWNKLKTIPNKISNLPNLTTLDLNHNQIADLTPLTNLINLTELYLDSNQIVDLIPLTNLTNLTKLYLHVNKIVNLTPLANLTNLTELCLGGNQIVDLTPLTNLTNLTRLYLDNNKISDLTPLATLTNLTTLNLYFNQIDDLTLLANLTNLTELYLNDNKIVDLTPLVNLTNLTTLDLYFNQISDLTPLVNLTNLTKLNLSNNKITMLPLSITNLRHLRYFDYYSNPIENLLNPIINRFINQNKAVNNFYSDTQNVHSSSIQQSIKDSLYNLMVQLTTPYTLNWFDDPILSVECKQALYEYSRDTTVHSQLNCTFAEALEGVLFEISHLDCDLQKLAKLRLNEEMSDAECKCFTGRISRLVNCLAGLSDKVQIKISSNEEISNVITTFLSQSKTKLDIECELISRGYTLDQIQPWLEHIE